MTPSPQDDQLELTSLCKTLHARLATKGPRAKHPKLAAKAWGQEVKSGLGQDADGKFRRSCHLRASGPLPSRGLSISHSPGAPQAIHQSLSSASARSRWKTHRPMLRRPTAQHGAQCNTSGSTPTWCLRECCWLGGQAKQRVHRPVGRIHFHQGGLGARLLALYGGSGMASTLSWGRAAGPKSWQAKRCDSVEER